MFYASGTYYIITSNKTGWPANPDKMFHAPAITGPWTGPFDVSTTGAGPLARAGPFEWAQWVSNNRLLVSSTVLNERMAGIWSTFLRCRPRPCPAGF